MLFSKDCEPKPKNFQSVGDVCAADPVLPKGPSSFLDLLKQVFPDLRPDGTSSGPVKTPRKYLGQMYLSEPEARSASGSGQKVFLPAGDFAYLKVGDRVAILDRSSGWLAYFQVQPVPKLLDMVGVAQDRLVSFATDTGVYPMSRGEFLFWVGNSHHNSGESYSIFNLFHAGGDQVDIAYDGPFLYSYLIPGPEDCRVTQNLTPVRAVGDSSGFPRLTMRVDQEKVCRKGEREVVSGRRGFDATLTWDAARRKYMGGSKELFKLNNCLIEGNSNCGV
ncbi:MAG TPA: hypothetical protein VJP40_09120 [bacterium]|nr:hypothetical protein [bacterium]